MTAADLRHDFDVQAEINYVCNEAHMGGPPLEFVTEDEARSTMQTLPGRLVKIREARAMPTSLEREGFVLVHHASSVPDFARIEEDSEVDQLGVGLSGSSHSQLSSVLRWRPSRWNS